MSWIDCLTDEINPKINTSIWIRRIWLDLTAFFLGLISVTTDFPSDIELGSPWGTPVPWKRICRVEWRWREPFDTCVLLQWDGMHNACGFNQTSSARLYRGCYLVCDSGPLPEWDGVSDSWRPCFLQCTQVNTHRLWTTCTQTRTRMHSYISQLIATSARCCVTTSTVCWATGTIWWIEVANIKINKTGSICISYTKLYLHYRGITARWDLERHNLPPSGPQTCLASPLRPSGGSVG